MMMICQWFKCYPLNFEKVVKHNGRGMAMSFSDLKRPISFSRFCAMSDNIEGLSQVVKRAKDIGADGLEGLDVVSWGKEYLKENSNDKTLESDIIKAKGIIMKLKSKLIEWDSSFSGGALPMNYYPMRIYHCIRTLYCAKHRSSHVLLQLMGMSQAVQIFLTHEY
jgi:hypothetical protein